MTITLTNGHQFEGYINPDYDELSIKLVTNPGGDTIYIAVSHIVSILRRPRRVPTDMTRPDITAGQFPVTAAT